MQDNLKPGKLDIVAMAQNKVRAEDSIIVYTNDNATRALARVDAEMSSIALNKDQHIERYNKLEAEAEELTAELNASKLTVHLQGLTQPELEEVEALAEKEGKPVDVFFVCKGLQKIVDSDGNTTEEFSIEAVEALRGLLNSEWFPVLDMMHELTFTQAYFTQAVDAGFLPRR